MAFIMADVDRFKQVNDRYGHQTGDRLLILVADRLNEGMRRTDTVARIGGDEFAILTPLGQESGLAVVNQRLRACFAAPFELGTTSLKMDMSLGYALYPDDGANVAALYKAADERMYRMKRSKPS